MSLWGKVWHTLAFGRPGGGCCDTGAPAGDNGLLKVGIVGSPNVGKSVIFNRLTGAYVTVSNYPGTTVDVSRGKARLDGREVEIVDTPGMYSLLPITEEEQVGRMMLLDERLGAIVHVVDAKNLSRMLPMTLQLIEAGLPVILDLNMMDETAAAGIEVDPGQLEKRLGIPVVATVATTGHGLETLRRRLAEYVGCRRAL